MLEELRIKCPSCGIILDVKNSRHEAIKRIVCPNCKKQLALDFRDEPRKDVQQKPLGALYHGEQRLELREGINQIPLTGCEFVEFNVVRLSDGNSKCIISPLIAGHTVKVNGQTLQSGDKVVLAVGDEVYTEGTLLVYGKPGRTSTPGIEPKQPQPKRPRKQSASDSNTNWFYGIIACVAVALLVVALWPSSEKAPSEVSNSQELVRPKDSVAQERQENPMRPRHVGKDETVQHPVEKQSEKQSGEQVGKSLKDLSDYDLEQLALKDDVEAQFELGNRLVRRRGSNYVIRGLNYLQRASRNGSSKASKVMENAIYSLQLKAADGDSIAQHILMSIR